MDGTKAKGKTIGEVEKITGIPKRELKYYIEQNIMRPSHRTESGYWAYSGEDILNARFAAMCRDLGFPTKAIRVILADSDACWPRELERHIIRLTDQSNLTNAQLQLANRLRDRDAWEALQFYCDNQTEETPLLRQNETKRR